ncbi:MAG: SRPBCC family protein [Longimicrobiaceae bacterium]
MELHIDAPPEVVFSVMAAIDEWPAWNPDVKSARTDGPLQPGTEFRWKSGPGTIVSRLQVVAPPHQIAWTGHTMGITATHVLRFEPHDDGTLARSEESWEGAVVRLFRRFSRRTLNKTTADLLSRLKAETERRVDPT